MMSCCSTKEFIKDFLGDQSHPVLAKLTFSSQSVNVPTLTALTAIPWLGLRIDLSTAFGRRSGHGGDKGRPCQVFSFCQSCSQS